MAAEAEAEAGKVVFATPHDREGLVVQVVDALVGLLRGATKVSLFFDGVFELLLSIALVGQEEVRERSMGWVC